VTPISVKIGDQKLLMWIEHLQNLELDMLSDMQVAQRYGHPKCRRKQYQATHMQNSSHRVTIEESYPIDESNAGNAK